MAGVSRREYGYAWGWGAAVMAVTCLPYLLMLAFTPPDGFFPGILFNSDDHGVYLAWMRQAHDGQLLFRNLFTTEPQRGVYLHLYFLLLGHAARWTGLALPLVYHLGRVLFGVVTLVLVYRLGACFTEDRFARRCMFWTAALSGGLGWLAWQMEIKPPAPIDVWQPEAFTFPSLYTNGLFCVSLALILGTVVCLLLAERRGWPWAVAAGLCGLLLGNVHSYDTIHLAVVWTGYLGLRWAVARRFPVRETGLALLAGIIALPSVLHMYWFYRTEPVFQARADTATLTSAPHYLLIGYGLLVPLAAWGGGLLGRGLRKERGTDAPLHYLLLLAWPFAGVVAAYLPFAFQRKMIMGLHFPLALLAGFALAEGARRLARGDARRAAAVTAAALLALAPSSALYLYRDVATAVHENLTSTRIHPVFWPAAEIRAFEWLGEHTPRDAVLLTLPVRGVLAPAYSGRTVYAGHWAETTQFQDRMNEAMAFYTGKWSSAERREFLRRHGITHVSLGVVEADLLRRSGAVPLDREPFLRPVFREGGVTLYAVEERG